MPKTIDVEKLLIWTYQDQRADLYAAGARMLPMERLADHHTVVNRSADGCALLEERQALGTKVDVIGYAVGGMKIDDDAEHVHGIVASLGKVSRIVMQHARVGTRPDWGVDLKAESIAPCYEVRRWWDEANPRHPGYLYCPFSINDNGGSVRYRRTRYLVWLSALVLVAWGLRQDTARLKRWQVTDDLPPGAPWNDPY
jgi:hypothetical protein